MKKITFSILLFFIVGLCKADTAIAATLVVIPSSVKVTEGSTFSVVIRTDTQGKSVNVAEATIGFSSDTLEIVSVGGGSTFTLQTPGSPGKTASSAYFSAGIPSGYTGSTGSLGKITFRAKKTGKGTISITSGKVLLNDGKATNVLKGTSGSTVTITPKSSIEPATPSKEQEVIDVPFVIEEVPFEEDLPVIVAPTETPEPQTVTIRTKDLFTLIYVLLGIIFILLGVIIVLVLVLARRKIPNRKL